MSILNYKKWTFVVLIIFFNLLFPVVAQEETDEILEYFKKRANEVYAGRNPLLSGLNFSFEATTYKKLYDKKKISYIVDSIVAQYFYSFGNLDSLSVLVTPDESFDSLDIQYPNVFTGEYEYNFYPNDTGGQEIAIGYDSKDFDTTVPIGIAMINRDYYFLTHLYMHYMNDKKIERSSKVMRFTEFKGFVFPDSIWELKSRTGIFTNEYYRIETGIRNFEIQR